MSLGVTLDCGNISRRRLVVVVVVSLLRFTNEMSVESRVRCSPFSAGCVCLMDSGESLVLVYDEIPSRCIRLFNGRAEEVMRVENIPCSLVDLCYSSSFSRFFLLSPSSLSQFDPSVGETPACH